MMKSKNTLSHSLKNGVYITTPGVTVLAAKPTCCHQDTALGIYNPLTQGVRGEACKLRHKTDKNMPLNFCTYMKASTFVTNQKCGTLWRL